MRKPQRGLTGEATLVFIGVVAATFGFLLFYGSGKGWPPSPREWGILIAVPLGSGCVASVLFLFPSRVREAVEVARYGWKGEQTGNQTGVGYINQDLLPRPQVSPEEAARVAEEARLQRARELEINELEARLIALRNPEGSAESGGGGVLG